MRRLISLVFARAEFEGVESCARALAAFGEPREHGQAPLEVRWTAGTRSPLLSPDGLRVVCDDGALWDLEAGVPIALCSGSTRWGGARFSPDGARLPASDVEWSDEGVVRVTVNRVDGTARRRVTFRARDRAGLLSRALRVTVTFSEER